MTDSLASLCVGSLARAGEVLLIEEVRPGCFSLVRPKVPGQFVPLPVDTELVLMLTEQLRARHCLCQHAVPAVVCSSPRPKPIIELSVDGKILPLHAFGTGVAALVKGVGDLTNVREVSVRPLES